jgi:hypothetical protein
MLAVTDFHAARAFAPGTVSFAPGTNTGSRHRVATRLYYESNSELPGPSDSDNIERARQQLEAMLAGANDPSAASSLNSQQMRDRQKKQLPIGDLIKRLSDPANSQTLGSILPTPPPLTAAERERRQAELKLLGQLASSDDATHELKFLWMSEKGPDAHDRLIQVDDCLANGQIIAAGQMLLKLFQDYDDTQERQNEIIYWSEPLLRMARLRSRQGRLQDAYQLCLVVLHLKPWHIGALDLVVDVAMKRGNREVARTWAARTLPKLIDTNAGPEINPKRSEWVNNSTEQAEQALSLLEYQTKHDFMGLPEEYYIQNSGDNSDNKAEGGTSSTKEMLPDSDNVLDISTQQIIVEDDADTWQ